MSIPVIDLKNTTSLNTHNIAEIVNQLRNAATTSGFFYVKNHGVDEGLIQRQFELSKRLFDLPLEIKLKYDQAKNPSHRGFEQIAAQKLDFCAKADFKEGFYCGKNYSEDHPYVVAKYQNYGINQWPTAEIPETEPYCQEYIVALNDLCEHIMKLLALSLALPENYFDECCKDPMVTLRLLKYPPHPKNADQDTFGAGAHTDWGAITVLAQDDLGGLEVCLPDGTWIEAPPIEDTFIVNLGDLIPRWSNGLYKSNPHRVRNRFSNGQARYSIPYFYGPSYFTQIDALPNTVKEGECYQYEPCTAGEHMEQMYRQSFDVKPEEIQKFDMI